MVVNIKNAVVDGCQWALGKARSLGVVVKSAVAAVALGGAALVSGNLTAHYDAAKPVAGQVVAAAELAGQQVIESPVMRAAGEVFSPAQASAQYAIVSADSSGNITFSPSALVTPVITGVIACVISAAALVLLWIGVRWLYKVLHGSK